jgi:hypothetical protein
MHLPYFNPALCDYQIYELCHMNYRNITALKNPASPDNGSSLRDA